jgi:hypothetical protein
MPAVEVERRAQIHDRVADPLQGEGLGCGDPLVAHAMIRPAARGKGNLLDRAEVDPL